METTPSDDGDGRVKTKKTRTKKQSVKKNTMDSFQDGGQQQHNSNSEATEYSMQMGSSHMNSDMNNYPPNANDPNMNPENFNRMNDMNPNSMPNYSAFNRGGFNMPEHHGEFNNQSAQFPFSQGNMRPSYPSMGKPGPGMSPSRPGMMPHQGMNMMSPPGPGYNQPRGMMSGQSASQQSGPTPTLNQLLQTSNSNPRFPNNFGEYPPGSKPGSDMVPGNMPFNMQQNWNSGPRGMTPFPPAPMPGGSPYRNQNESNRRPPSMGGNNYPNQGGQFQNQQFSPNSRNYNMMPGQSRSPSSNQQPYSNQMHSQFNPGGNPGLPFNQSGPPSSQPNPMYLSPQHSRSANQSPTSQPGTPLSQSGVQQSPVHNQTSPVPPSMNENSRSSIKGQNDDSDGGTKMDSSSQDEGDSLQDTPTSTSLHPSLSSLRRVPSPAGSTGSRSNTPASLPGNHPGSPMPPRPPSGQIDGQGRLTQSPMATQGYNQQIMPPPIGPNQGPYVAGPQGPGPNKMGSSGGPMPGHFPQYNSQYPGGGNQGSYGRMPNPGGMSNFPPQNMYNGPNPMGGNNPVYNNMPRHNMPNSNYSNAYGQGNMGMNMPNQYGGYNNMGPNGPQPMNSVRPGFNNMPPSDSPNPTKGANAAAAAAQAAMIAAANSAGNIRPPLNQSRMNNYPSMNHSGPIGQLNHMTVGLGAPPMNNAPNNMNQPNNSNIVSNSASQNSATNASVSPKDNPAKMNTQGNTSASVSPGANNSSNLHDSSSPNQNTENNSNVNCVSQSDVSSDQSNKKPINSTESDKNVNNVPSNDSSGQGQGDMPVKMSTPNEASQTVPSGGEDQMSNSSDSMSSNPNAIGTQTIITPPSQVTNQSNMPQNAPDSGAPVNNMPSYPDEPPEKKKKDYGYLSPAGSMAHSPGGVSISSYDEYDVTSPGVTGQKSGSVDLSKLYEMGNEPDRKLFIDKLLSFNEDKGAPITGMPAISKQPLDLYKLYQCVKERGGMIEVNKVKKWKEICTIVNIGSSASAAFTLKKNYIKYLFHFECHYDRGGMDPQPILAQMEAALAQKREQKNKRAPSPAGSQGSSQDAFRPPSTPNSQGLDPFSPGPGMNPHYMNDQGMGGMGGMMSHGGMMNPMNPHNSMMGPGHMGGMPHPGMMSGNNMMGGMGPNSMMGHGGNMGPNMMGPGNMMRQNNMMGGNMPNSMGSNMPNNMGNMPNNMGNMPNNMGNMPNSMSGNMPNSMGNMPNSMSGNMPNNMGNMPNSMGNMPNSMSGNMPNAMGGNMMSGNMPNQMGNHMPFSNQNANGPGQMGNMPHSSMPGHNASAPNIPNSGNMPITTMPSSMPNSSMGSNMSNPTMSGNMSSSPMPINMPKSSQGPMGNSMMPGNVPNSSGAGGMPNSSTAVNMPPTSNAGSMPTTTAGSMPNSSMATTSNSPMPTGMGSNMPNSMPNPGGMPSSAMPGNMNTSGIPGNMPNSSMPGNLPNSSMPGNMPNSSMPGNMMHGNGPNSSMPGNMPHMPMHGNMNAMGGPGAMSGNMPHMYGNMPNSSMPSNMPNSSMPGNMLHQQMGNNMHGNMGNHMGGMMSNMGGNSLMSTGMPNAMPGGMSNAMPSGNPNAVTGNGPTSMHNPMMNSGMPYQMGGPHPNPSMPSSAPTTSTATTLDSTATINSSSMQRNSGPINTGNMPNTMLSSSSGPAPNEASPNSTSSNTNDATRLSSPMNVSSSSTPNTATAITEPNKPNQTPTPTPSTGQPASTTPTPGNSESVSVQDPFADDMSSGNRSNMPQFNKMTPGNPNFPQTSGPNMPPFAANTSTPNMPDPYRRGGNAEFPSRPDFNGPNQFAGRPSGQFPFGNQFDRPDSNAPGTPSQNNMRMSGPMNTPNTPYGGRYGNQGMPMRPNGPQDQYSGTPGYHGNNYGPRPMGNQEQYPVGYQGSYPGPRPPFGTPNKRYPDMPIYNQNMYNDRSAMGHYPTSYQDSSMGFHDPYMSGGPRDGNQWSPMRYPHNPNYMPPGAPGTPPMGPYGQPMGPRQRMKNMKQKAPFQPQVSQKRTEIPFPPDTIEGIHPLLIKRRRLTSKDLGPIDSWRLMMALKSGLLTESTWALDTLNILLFDDTTVSYFNLSHLPGLLDVLLEHFRRCIYEVFTDMVDFDEDISKETSMDMSSEEKLDSENFTFVTRNGKEVEIEDESMNALMLETKSWDRCNEVMADENFGHLDHIVTKMESAKTNMLLSNLFSKYHGKHKDKRKFFAKDSVGFEDDTDSDKDKINIEEIIESEKLSSDKEYVRNNFIKSEPKSVDEEDSKNNKPEIKMEVDTDAETDKEKGEEEKTVDDDKSTDSNVKEELPYHCPTTYQKTSVEVMSLAAMATRPQPCNDLEEESYEYDKPPLYNTAYAHEELAKRCTCISNIFRSLSCIPGNGLELSQHLGLMSTLGKLLLLHHRHLPRSKKHKLDKDLSDWNDNEDGVKEGEWWWACLDILRENTLVIYANISGKLKLADYPENIAFPILDGLLHWVVCTSSCARDPMPNMPPNSVLSPQRLVLEALCKLCIYDTNVDLLLATPPFERVIDLFETLVKLLSNRKEQVTQEFSIVLLSELVKGDSSIARALALQHQCISLLVDFLETAEQNAHQVAKSQGISVLQNNPESMGTSLDMLRRSATILVQLARVEENRTLFVHQQSRILALVMSQILDQTVAKILSDVLFECSQLS